MKKPLIAIALAVSITAPAYADYSRPNRAEFYEWVGENNSKSSYVFVCTVRIQSGSLSLRATPGGRKVGALRNGYDFDLGDVRRANDGRDWYLVNPFNGRSEKGWVASEYVTCDPEHLM